MGFLESYNYYMTDYADPRVNDAWLMRSPIPVIIILFNYLYFIKVCGPKYMKNRNPYDLRTFTRFYNLFQILINAYIVYKFTKGWLAIGFPLGCTVIDYSYEPVPYMLSQTCLLTFYVKLTDLIETCVMVLRKKQNQVSFLHVYHHVSMVAIVWPGVKYHPGGMGVPGLGLNSAVHVFMYSYYFFSSYPQITKYLRPIKPYITRVQMIQFVILAIYICQVFLPTCKDGPVMFSVIFVTNVVLNFILFSNFYKKEYVEKSDDKNKLKAK